MLIPISGQDPHAIPPVGQPRHRVGEQAGVVLHVVPQELVGGVDAAQPGRQPAQVVGAERAVDHQHRPIGPGFVVSAQPNGQRQLDQRVALAAAGPPGYQQAILSAQRRRQLRPRDEAGRAHGRHAQRRVEIVLGGGVEQAEGGHAGARQVGDGFAGAPQRLVIELPGVGRGLGHPRQERVQDQIRRTVGGHAVVDQPPAQPAPPTIGVKRRPHVALFEKGQQVVAGVGLQKRGQLLRPSALLTGAGGCERVPAVVLAGHLQPLAKGSDGRGGGVIHRQLHPVDRLGGQVDLAGGRALVELAQGLAKGLFGPPPHADRLARLGLDRPARAGLELEHHVVHGLGRLQLHAAQRARPQARPLADQDVEAELDTQPQLEGRAAPVRSPADGCSSHCTFLSPPSMVQIILPRHRRHKSERR